MSTQSSQTVLPPPRVFDVDLALRTSLFASGLNAAAQRPPAVHVLDVPLPTNRDIAVRTLRPRWARPRVIGVEFSESPAPSDAPRQEPSEEPRTAQPARQRHSRRTRLRPPDGAISLKDRLFYLLQPPLETILGGQEMVMPFEPFPYQYEGIGWLFSHSAALLADEMGLGKTMQTITAIRLLLRAGQIRRVMLVCPKPLIPNWMREFRLWAEEIPIAVVAGATAARRMLWRMPPAPVLLVNYELLVRDMEQLESEGLPRFDLVVLDEAQRIKNRESRTAQTARSIPRQRSWALTGTPIENRPEELAALFEFLEVVPPRAVPDLRQLSRLADRFILRRTKDLVMTDLPPRLDRDEYLELTPAQQQAYRIAEREGIVRLNAMGESITVQHVFELVLRLKQIANFDPLTGESAKLDRLQADMEEIAASGGKAILFSQWTKCLDWLAERLQPYGPLIYHGGVPTKQREPILQRFREDPRCHILLMSYGTGAVGLNLQFAGYVFLFDRWWNPAVEDQAINRAHRIGQKNPVIVTKFIAKDTIEERIDRVLQQKRQLFEQVLGEPDRPDRSLGLTAAEIFGLFDLKTPHGKRIRAKPPAAAAEAAKN
ncbi:MAG: DEAD/DEAH box helicase [Planctomycetota bacterium]|nr:MAG: DEAD/DEAH box helicase [Planctomycetota bacterium]